VKTWKAVLIPIVITLIIGGIYLAIVFHNRAVSDAAVRKAAEPHYTADEVAIDRQEFPAHFDDVQDLAGKSVWMRNGYTMPYFPYAGGRVNFAKQVGLLAPAQRLDVKKAIKAVAPASVSDRISHGDHQAMIVFSLPGSPNTDSALYATPVGVLQGDNEQYFDDMLFFYDDPHTIYSHWPKETWAAIDAHQPKPNMNELQMSLAIGMNITTDSQTPGDRTVNYDTNGKKTAVTFAGDKATSIQAQ
jgi:YD repeat-containing protein